jgi:23S rRNA (cytosine1962-C5)-methyltransferase
VYSKITLQKGKEISVQRLHPWLFSGAIKLKEGFITEGSIVEVFGSNGQYLCTGLYGSGSIAVRVISYEQVKIDTAFWVNKIAKAWEYRQNLGILNSHTNCCRLFFAEGDGVPGLVLDYYDGHVIFQAHNIGVYQLKADIVVALQHVLGTALKSIFDKSADTLGKHAKEKSVNGFLLGQSGSVAVTENDVKFEVDFVNGQKTGFFLDQRVNREILMKYAKGRKVLNTFSYTGGFSIYAAKAGAMLVHSVDVSASAIDICNQNAELNHLTNHQAFVADTFDFLKDKQGQYDCIILDPPAFTKSRDTRHQAIIGYKRLNAMAMKMIQPGGILFTFSCSGVVDKFLFYNTIAAAAMESGRDVKILEYLNQPPDHPVTPYFPEGEYLKGMILYIR